MTDNQVKPKVRVESVEMDYWNIQQDNYQDKVAFLTNHTKEELVRTIIRYQYDAFCRDHADVKDGSTSWHPSNKNIPYIGWFRRTIDFTGYVPIGRVPHGNEGPGFIGFIGNNKWDYPERDLTDEERMRVISYLDRAIAASRSPIKVKEDILKELWDYMQTLTIP